VIYCCWAGTGNRPGK